MPHDPRALPEFTSWPTFPFEGDLRVKALEKPAEVEPARQGEDPEECSACRAPDAAYIWVSARWRVRALDRPTGLPMVLILESRSHLDLGDLPNLLAAELGVMTVRLERAIRSIEGVARVHINRWGDGSAHLHLWFLARPYGRLQLRGTFLSLWDDILPPIPEAQWRENLAMVAAWLGEFGGRPLAQPPPLDWKAALADAPEVDLPAPETAGPETAGPEGDGHHAEGSDEPTVDTTAAVASEDQPIGADTGATAASAPEESAEESAEESGEPTAEGGEPTTGAGEDGATPDPDPATDVAGAAEKDPVATAAKPRKVRPRKARPDPKPAEETRAPVDPEETWEEGV